MFTPFLNSVIIKKYLSISQQEPLNVIFYNVCVYFLQEYRSFQIIIFSCSQIIKVLDVLPDEVQKSIGSLYRFNISTFNHRTVPAASPRPDDHDDHDANKHRSQGGHHVVDHGTHTHLT